MINTITLSIKPDPSGIIPIIDGCVSIITSMVRDIAQQLNSPGGESRRDDITILAKQQHDSLRDECLVYDFTAETEFNYYLHYHAEKLEIKLEELVATQ